MSEPPPDADRVVCVGLTTLDLVYRVDVAPGPNAKVQARSSFRTLGGPATNAALTAALLGSPTTLVSRFPPADAVSFFGGQFFGDLVAVVDVASGGERFAVSSIVVDAQGGRSVVSENAAGWGPPAATPPAEGSVLLADGHDPVVLAEVLRQTPAPIRILDAGSWKAWMAGARHAHGPAMADFSHVVASADFAVPGVSRGSDTLAWLLDQGVLFAARTAGAGPTSWRTASGEEGVIDPFDPPEPVRDTLGAGDVLHGALAHFLARTAPADPVTAAVSALTDAMRVATFSVCRDSVWAGVEFFLTTR